VIFKCDFFLYKYPLMTTQKSKACEKSNYYGLKRVVSILYY